MQGGADEGHHDKSAVWKVKKGNCIRSTFQFSTSSLIVDWWPTPSTSRQMQFLKPGVR